jgi:hypothetical protein
MARFRRVVLTGVGILLYSILAQGSSKHFACKEWKLERRIEKEWSSLLFLQSKDKRRIVLKQLKGHPVRFISNLVADTIGAFIAQSVDIPCNEVTILPIQHTCMHKKRVRQPASLHTLIEGKTLEQQPLRAYKTIVQLKTNGRSKIFGLTYAVINAMSKHPDLPGIAAIDTFMGNVDRLPKNIMHHNRTKRLYAIDFTLAFNTNLARYSVKNFKELLHRNLRFTSSELQALEIYKDTLKHLLKTHTPGSLVACIHQAFLQTGFLHSKHYPQTIKKLVTDSINHYKQLARDSYKSTQELVRLLETVV